MNKDNNTNKSLPPASLKPIRTNKTYTEEKIQKVQVWKEYSKYLSKKVNEYEIELFTLRQAQERQQDLDEEEQFFQINLELKDLYKQYQELKNVQMNQKLATEMVGSGFETLSCIKNYQRGGEAIIEKNKALLELDTQVEELVKKLDTSKDELKGIEKNVMEQLQDNRKQVAILNELTEQDKENTVDADEKELEELKTQLHKSKEKLELYHLIFNNLVLESKTDWYSHEKLREAMEFDYYSDE